MGRLTMFQQAAIANNPRRQQQAYTKSLPAPVGGWNDRDSLPLMQPQYAVILDNFWPLPSKVIVRKGRTAWTTGISGQVESLMAYNPQTGTAALFGAAGTAFYNVTDAGAVGAAVVSGLTNARWQHTNMSTSGGSFLMAVNGADKLRGWDASAWWADGDGTHDITGVDTATCIGINVFKRRLWLIQDGTASAWYLPTDAIAGAAQELDLGPIFRKGGKLMVMVNWSLDAGAGADDYAAFISDQGEVAIYQGTDPASASTWALRGLYLIGAPIGRRCTGQLAGDVMVISRDGLIPLSKALMSSRVNTSVALTDKIQNATSSAAALYASTFGWQVIQYPGEDMVIMNVPVGIGSQQQYVMNTITGAWARFKGWAANCFELFNGDMYMGGSGSTSKIWSTQADAGANINAEGLQAFNYFGSTTGLKMWTLARPLVAISNTAGAGFKYGLNTDFDTTPPTGVPTVTGSTAGQWQSGQWDVALWGGQPVMQKAWQGVTGIGQCAAMHLIAASNSSMIEWSATDYAFKRGGIL
jgi:hypothetical protein